MTGDGVAANGAATNGAATNGAATNSAAANGAADPAGPALRASDADREAVVRRLQAACAEGRLSIEEFGERSGAAYAARTHAELAALTGDLPVAAGDPPLAVGVPPLAVGVPPLAVGVPPLAVGVPPLPVGAPESGSEKDAPSGSPIVAVFGGAERRGRWRPARRETAVAVFGGIALDFREAELPGPVEIRAVAVFGGIDIAVPEGSHVELTGFSLFGGRGAAVGHAPSAPSGAVFRVHAVAIFGGVNVRAKRPRRPRP